MLQEEIKTPKPLEVYSFPVHSGDLAFRKIHFCNIAPNLDFKRKLNIIYGFIYILSVGIHQSFHCQKVFILAEKDKNQKSGLFPIKI